MIRRRAVANPCLSPLTAIHCEPVDGTHVHVCCTCAPDVMSRAIIFEYFRLHVTDYYNGISVESQPAYSV